MVHLRVGVGLKRTYCLTYQDVSYKKVTEEKTVNFIVIVSSSKEPSNILMNTIKSKNYFEVFQEYQ